MKMNTLSQKRHGQHYLLTRGSKTITAEDIDSMSEQEIADFIMLLRWGKVGEQGCPYCGTLNNHYFLATRHLYKCKHCGKQFSLTSGSAFHSRKLPLRKILKMMLTFILNVKGISAIAISREFDLTYKTAFAWLHKFRTMAKASCLSMYPISSQDESSVHLDGTYVHTNIRKANKKVERKDARLLENANKDKRCVFAIVKNWAEDTKAQGSKAILPFIIPAESSEIVNKIVKNHVKKGTTICTDDSHAYDDLLLFYDLQRVNHSVEYRSDLGVTNNQAESFSVALNGG